MEDKRIEIFKMKKIVGFEPIIFTICFVVFFGLIGSRMGAVNLINTMMNTASALLMDTVWYIMAIAVLAGALGTLLTEFGVVALLNKILSPLIRPLYGMPGASMIGILTTFLSDNPAILTLADDNNFKRFFKKYQIPALANIGTSFGMGLIVITFMVGLSRFTEYNFFIPVMIGLLGAIVGSVVSTRIMLLKTARVFGRESMALEDSEAEVDFLEYRNIRSGGLGKRFLDAILTGGKSGVKMGLGIIPGVLVICTMVMILTNGTSDTGNYTGAAYEGVAFLPWVADKLGFILEPIFGFTYDGAIAVPITALGSAGAALGLIPEMVSGGYIGGNEVAVFTAMCMCWSGYLSTHIAMMDELDCSELAGHAILSHTIGGLIAGICAHLIFMLVA